MSVCVYCVCVEVMWSYVILNLLWTEAFRTLQCISNRLLFENMVYSVPLPMKWVLTSRELPKTAVFRKEFWVTGFFWMNLLLSHRIISFINEFTSADQQRSRLAEYSTCLFLLFPLHTKATNNNNNTKNQPDKPRKNWFGMQALHDYQCQCQHLNGAHIIFLVLCMYVLLLLLFWCFGSSINRKITYQLNAKIPVLTTTAY